MEIREARRVKNLPPYLFAQIDRLIEEKKKQGVDVISLGIGDPVEPSPSIVLKALKEALKNPENHRYPSYFGLSEFRETAAKWMKKRFGVDLHPDKEILPVIGSKEGIAHLPWAMVDPGDYVLVPDPGYPVYATATILSEGIPYLMPLKWENHFLADFEAVPSGVVKKSKLMFLNYPNNPTSATADLDYFKNVIEWARKNGIVVAHDNAYSEITFNDYIAPSILQIEGALEVAVEFHSLSKTLNMTGWRIGFVAGNEKVLNALGRLKTNIDSGIFNPIQYAGIAGLRNYEETVARMRRIYENRKKLITDFLDKVGLKYWKSGATIYIWVVVPEKETSSSFARKLLEEAAVVVSPGAAYGNSGEGYVRISLTVKDERLKEAIVRLERVLQ